MVNAMFTMLIKNVQAIKEAMLHFGSNGITEFIGDNSNGKSIITKFLEYLVAGDVADKVIRNDLINDDENDCSVVMQWKSKRLTVYLHRERSQCFVSLIRDVNKGEEIGNVVRRDIADKGYLELLYEFGFRTYQNGEICLQIAPTYGAIPFVTTKGATNTEIVDAISTDAIAEEFIEAFEKITAQTFRSRLQNLQAQKLQLETLIDNCNVGNYERFRELSTEIGALLQAVKHYKPMVIDEISVPPDVEIIDLPAFEVTEIPLYEFGPIKSEVPFLDKELGELIQLLDGICPTCGKPLVEG